MKSTVYTNEFDNVYSSGTSGNQGVSENTISDSVVDSSPEVESVKEMVWVLNNGKKYHKKSDCSGMESPKQVSLEDALSRVYGL